VEFEGDPFYEMAHVVSTTDNIRVRLGRGASYCDCPPVCMFRVDSFALFRGESRSSVSIDNWT
jgi:hypothetical protein